MIKTLSSCDLCGSGSDNVNVLAVSDKEPLEWVKCKKCGLVYMKSRLNSFTEHFDENYYDRLQTVSRLPKNIKRTQKQFKEIEKHKSPGKLLDVGCGIGPFLQIGLAKSWDVYGVEVSSWACEYVKKNLGIEIFNGELQQACFPDECFDAVILWHVIEHVERPNLLLKEVFRILKKGGLLLIATPNFDNFIFRCIYRLVKGNDPGIGFSDDLYSFSPLTISEILRKVGFNVIALKPLVKVFPFSKYEQFIDYLSFLFYFFTGRVGSLFMKVLARK